MSPQSGNSTPRRWLHLKRYIEIHETCTEHLLQYAIVRHDLVFEQVGLTIIRLSGQVHCHGDLVLDVRKLLERHQHDEMLGRSYSYQARFLSSSHRPDWKVFRYDNAHDNPPHFGHEDAYHKHVFDPYTGEEIGHPLHIGYASWPTLSRVILEMHEWWLHYHNDPFIYPDTADSSKK